MSFTWSFDGPLPLQDWTAPFVSIAAGRHDDGARFGGIGSLSHACTGDHVGVAYNTDSFGNTPIEFFGPNLSVAQLTHIGDGRLRVAVSTLGQGYVDVAYNPVLKAGRWFFLEFGLTVSIFVVDDNGNGTSNVALGIDYAVKVNNDFALSGQFYSTFVRNNPVTIPSIATVRFGAPGGGLGASFDDVYIDTVFKGDGRAYYDAGASGEFWATDVADPASPQQLVEIGCLAEAPDNTVESPQQLVEVGVAQSADGAPEYVKRRNAPGNG